MHVGSGAADVLQEPYIPTGCGVIRLLFLGNALMSCRKSCSVYPTHCSGTYLLSLEICWCLTGNFLPPTASLSGRLRVHNSAASVTEITDLNLGHHHHNHFTVCQRIVELFKYQNASQVASNSSASHLSRHG